MQTNDLKVEQALRGELLYGDNFTAEQIAQWFEDEKDGYFNLYYGAENPVGPDSAEYEYAQLAEQHCYKWLPKREFANALGVGSAHGAELKPILQRSMSVTVLEPSDGFASTTIDGKSVTYVKPHASGLMPFETLWFVSVFCTTSRTCRRSSTKCFAFSNPADTRCCASPHIQWATGVSRGAD
jgi:hypothetical protein